MTTKYQKAKHHARNMQASQRQMRARMRELLGQRDRLVTAMIGLLDAEAELMPPYEAGIEAKHDWVVRRATARDAARAAIAEVKEPKP